MAPPSVWGTPNSFVEQGHSYNLLQTIQDAIAYAYALGAPYTSASITILLRDTTTATPFHSMVRYNPVDFYIPQVYDSWSQTTKITIDTVSG